MAFGLDDAIGAGLSIINKFIPDGEAKAKAEAELRLAVLSAATTSDVSQNTTNAAEAANSNLFVSGWRPAIGWVCALAFFWQYVGRPMAQWYYFNQGATLPALPGIDEGLNQLMLGMLGLGGLRTFEKLKGVSK